MVRRYDGCDVVRSEVDPRKIRLLPVHGQVFRLQHKDQQELSVIRLHLHFLQDAVRGDMSQVQSLSYVREFQVHSVIFPRGHPVCALPAGCTHLPVHRVQDRILVRDIKCVPVSLQVFRHTGLSRKNPGSCLRA